MHPGQFVVLSSDSQDVVANSVKILQMHADIMDLLQQPRSPWALLEVHGGKANRSHALVAAIAQLPDAIRSRLGLENDEYSYSAEPIFQICKRSGLPMVFDAQHHIVHHKRDRYDDPSVGDMLLKAQATWADPAHQLVHIGHGEGMSSGLPLGNWLISQWPAFAPPRLPSAPVTSSRALRHMTSQQR